MAINQWPKRFLFSSLANIGHLNPFAPSEAILCNGYDFSQKAHEKRRALAQPCRYFESYDWFTGRDRLRGACIVVFFHSSPQSSRFHSSCSSSVVVWAFSFHPTPQSVVSSTANTFGQRTFSHWCCRKGSTETARGWS